MSAIISAPPSTSAACRHCGVPAGTRPRGLCRHCFYDPSIRSRYPKLDPKAGAGTRPPCRHCKKRPANKGRGLCHPCHDDEKIWEQYPAKHDFRWPEDMPLRPPARPTTATPGPHKIPSLQARYANGEAFFHPKDYDPRTASETPHYEPSDARDRSHWHLDMLDPYADPYLSWDELLARVRWRWDASAPRPDDAYPDPLRPWPDDPPYVPLVMDPYGQTYLYGEVPRRWRRRRAA
jgi:hypothetical protein